QNYREAPLTELPHEGLSADYVARETRRALAGVSTPSAESAPAAKAPGTPKIWPGIDIDIPTGQDEKKTEPQDVREAVRAALAAAVAPDPSQLTRKGKTEHLDKGAYYEDFVLEGGRWFHWRGSGRSASRIALGEILVAAKQHSFCATFYS